MTINTLDEARDRVPAIDAWLRMAAKTGMTREEALEQITVALAREYVRKVADVVRGLERATPPTVFRDPRAPHRCPVCTGTGKVSRPPYVAGDVETWPSTSAGITYQCNACLGRGIVWAPVAAPIDEDEAKHG